MKIKGQFICNDEGNIFYMTLREWVKQLELKPLQPYLFNTNLRGKTAAVYYRGYGVKWEDFQDHFDELFYANNADLSIISLHYKNW